VAWKALFGDGGEGIWALLVTSLRLRLRFATSRGKKLHNILDLTGDGKESLKGGRRFCAPEKPL